MRDHVDITFIYSEDLWNFLGYQWGLVLNQPVYDCMAWGYNAFQIHHSFMKVNMAMEITIVATTSFTPGYKLPK